MTLPNVEMHVFETILARRSIRNYTAQKVDRTLVRTLLEAAVHAPSAMHQEPWAFAVIQNRSLLQQLSDHAKPLFVEELRRSHPQRTGHDLQSLTHSEFNIFYNAGTLIVICAKPAGSLVVADCWLAAENLMLAACAMGLGTCVIGMALPALTLPELKQTLGIADEFTAIVPIIVGYPNGETPPTPRKEPLILAYLSATDG
ncbi:MAG: nitroreductase family protein [Methylophilaceae bacterium]